MRALLKGNKILFKDVEYTLNNELYKKYNLQTNEIYLKSDLSWSLSFEESLSVLRKIRDEKIRITDYLFLSDNSYLTTTTEKTELKVKRKALRDATIGLTTVEEVLEKIKSL